MTYLEALEAEVSAQEAHDEIEKHDCEGGWDAFVAEFGAHQTYLGSDVLGWLGY